MLSIVGYVSLSVYVAISAVKYLLSRYYLARNLDCNEPATSADVTVLQPILSGDPLLEQTLWKSIANAPNGSEFWLLVDEDDAEGLRVAEVIRERKPEIVRVVICQPPQQGHNPKAAKLDSVLGRVESTFTAVLDDDTWLPDSNLQRATGRMAECDLYTGLPCYVPVGGWWSSLVAHFVNNNNVMTYLSFLPITGPLTINGMYYVVRTDSMKQLGGWNASADLLCDDLAIADSFRTHGLKLHQGVSTQLLNTTVPSGSAYFSIMHRWYVFADILVEKQTLPNKLLIISLLGLPPLLLWLGLLATTGGVPGILFLLVVLVLRHLAIRDLLLRVVEKPPVLSWWQSLVSEFIQPIHWIHAKLSRTILWRGRKIIAHRDGRFTYVDHVSK